MSLTYVKNNNNTLGKLGTLGLTLGKLMGNPLLTSLGTGMTAADSIFNGTANKDTYSAYEEALDGILNGWKNLGSGNIAKENPEAITDEQYAELLARGWGR